ncbi:MAG: PqqD family protein [Bacteroidales bacterium]|nr:PqqD family protein [Bacteroidales bacterium]
MRFDERKKVRTVAGENIVIMQADGEADMTKVVALNESAMLVYEQLKDKELAVTDVARVLTDGYEVDEATAMADAEELVASMRREHLIID